MGVGDLSFRRAVFLDRDGVLNRNVLDPASGEYGAPLRPEQFELVPEAGASLALLQRQGYLLFLISNQPNLAKGKSSLEELEAIHHRLERALEEAGVQFSEFYYCYHHPLGAVAGYSGACDCRKPSPFFLFQARDSFGLALDQCWMVGDRATDIECGKRANARTIRIMEDHPATRAAGETKADFEARDLADAVRCILAHA